MSRRRPGDIVLWHFQGSHFCEKARWALDWKKIPHVRQVLGASYLPRAFWRTGRGTLPVLFLGRQTIGDSTQIIEALEHYRADPPLYPEKDIDKERCLALETYFDEELGHPVRAAAFLQPLARDPNWIAGFAASGLGDLQQRVFSAIAPVFCNIYRSRHGITAATAESGRVKVAAVLDRITEETQPSGYLVGDSFSVADLTAAALLASILGVPDLEYPLPEPIPASILEYRQSLAAHPSAMWVHDIYRRHRGTSAEIQVSRRAAPRSV